MASLATLAEFRTAQPALAAVPDAQAQAALDAVSAYVRGLVGPVLAADFGTGYDAKVRKSGEFASAGLPSFVLPSKFATAVAKIDGAAYAGAAGTDYWIDGETLTFLSCPSWATPAPFAVFTLTGGSACPDDLKHAVTGLAAYDLTQEGGKGVKSQTLGPRSVSYGTAADAPAGVQSFLSCIRKYIPVSVA